VFGIPLVNAASLESQLDSMKTTIVVASAVLLLAVALIVRKSAEPSITALENRTSIPASDFARLRRTTSTVRMPLVAAEATVEQAGKTNLIAQLLHDGEAPKLTAEQIESYLAENRRSVESLLTAFRSTKDNAFLKEAQTKSPYDPRVNFDAAAFALHDDASPEERRRSADAFKRAAPDNAMANYLSALAYFKSGQTDEAVQEVVAASGNGRFEDYSMDFMQAAEEAYRSAGYSDAESKAIAMTQLLLPHLAELKQVGVTLGDLAKSYRAAGDEASERATLQLAANLGQNLQQPSGFNTIIGDLVGKAIERIALNAMDSSSAYGPSGETVQARLDEIETHRAATKALVQQSTPLLDGMSEPELSTYFERLKLFGEPAALQWAMAKYGKQ
jgi:hypothetical protein